ncbi:MAG TPA: hypothetical protein EYH46_07105 [Sulfurivirga caldicuralii]|nr:hypothetical protein [Sulfurivirga caldicuralii]
MMGQKLFGWLGLLIWIGTLPWVQLTWQYGAQDASVPQWAFILVAATLGVMTVSVPLWLCSLCFSPLARWSRFYLPGVLFAAAFYGWISLSAVAQLHQAQDIKSVILLFSPLLMTLWLVLSIPLQWRNQHHAAIPPVIPPDIQSPSHHTPPSAGRRLRNDHRSSRNARHQ